MDGTPSPSPRPRERYVRYHGFFVHRERFAREGAAPILLHLNHLFIDEQIRRGVLVPMENR